MTPKEPGCYILNFIETGTFYVGSTGNLRLRLSDHLNALNKGTHQNKPLQQMFDQDQNVVVEYVTSIDRETAYDIEQAELDKYLGNPKCINQGNDARNHWKPGTRPPELQERMNVKLRGKIRTPEQRQRISEAALTRPPVSEERRQKTSDQWKGKPKTEEQKEKIRQAAKRRWANRA